MVFIMTTLKLMLTHSTIMNNIQRATDFRGLYTQTLLNTQTGEGACFLPYIQKHEQ